MIIQMINLDQCRPPFLKYDNNNYNNSNNRRQRVIADT